MPRIRPPDRQQLQQVRPNAPQDLTDLTFGVQSQKTPFAAGAQTALLAGTDLIKEQMRKRQELAQLMALGKQAGLEESTLEDLGRRPETRQAAIGALAQKTLATKLQTPVEREAQGLELEKTRAEIEKLRQPAQPGFTFLGASTTGQPIFANPKQPSQVITPELPPGVKLQPRGRQSTSEQELRKEFTALPQVKSFTDINRSYTALQSALAESQAKGAAGGSRAASDQALVTLFNKMLDPTSVVREGEYARSFEGQAALARAQGYLERLSKGGGGFSDENRQDMVNIAQRLYDDSQNTFNQTSSFYENVAAENQINPKNIIFRPQSPKAPTKPVLQKPQAGQVGRFQVKVKK